MGNGEWAGVERNGTENETTNLWRDLERQNQQYAILKPFATLLIVSPL